MPFQISSADATARAPMNPGYLFKHRFVGLVNFNFDELLDRAIDDEVGRQNCWMISSDGDSTGNVGPMSVCASRGVSLTARRVTD